LKVQLCAELTQLSIKVAHELLIGGRYAVTVAHAAHAKGLERSRASIESLAHLNPLHLASRVGKDSRSKTAPHSFDGLFTCHAEPSWLPSGRASLPDEFARALPCAL